MKGVPTTRTGAENADLAIVIGLRAYPLHCGLAIADHLGVGNAAVGAHFGGDVVWVALARTLIEVGADREIARDARTDALAHGRVRRRG
jgi:hypothetical protein